MRTILIGAVGSTRVFLNAMREAGHPPSLLMTLDPVLGPKRHDDYVDLAQLAGPETRVLHVEDINDAEHVQRAGAEEADVIFVIGWSQIAGPAIRAAASRFCVGFHPTLLPALRGRAALGWTLVLGLEETGGTLFVIDDEVDNGPILAQARFPVDDRETLASLIDKHHAALAAMARDLLPRLRDGTAVPIPQDTQGVSYAARRAGGDGLIDWTRPLRDVDRLIRASGRPYRGAFAFTRTRRITIWSAEPVSLPHRYHAAPGQIVVYSDGRPVVLCGDGGLLMITEYHGGDGAQPLSGQVRLRSRPAESWE